MHTTQPGISARINALEDELGVQIFIRDKSGTRLTAKGVQLLPYAEKILAISYEMKDQLSDDQQQRGNIRIGITDTLAYIWLASLLEHWQAQHPLLSFELTSDISQRLIDQLSDHQLDLALIVDQSIANPALVSEPLCSYSQKWVAAPQRLNNQTIDSIDTLAKHPILSFPRNTQPWLFLQDLFADQVKIPQFHTSTSVSNLMTMTQQGMGIALLATPLVEEDLNTGRLVELNIPTQAPALHFSFSWRIDDERILPKLLADSGREIIAPTD